MDCTLGREAAIAVKRCAAKGGEGAACEGGRAKVRSDVFKVREVYMMRCTTVGMVWRVVLRT